ncbi:MAG: tetratricopeptide repeat protein [Planctomycetota bacterium]
MRPDEPTPGNGPPGNAPPGAGKPPPPDTPITDDATVDLSETISTEPPSAGQAPLADGATVDLSETIATGAPSAAPIGDDATVAFDGSNAPHPVGTASSDGAPPTAIGPYQIVAELGRGGMGVVYLAEDPRLKRRIALKVLPDEVVANTAALEAFEREAQLLAALNHPNIATIFSLEGEGGLRYFTMEHLQGQSLQDRLKEEVSFADALGIAKQIAGGLQAAHTRGVIHRDLKPGNVMLASDGTAKILDFGIATARGQAAEDLGLDDANPSMAGTPGYMSPEQLSGGPLGEGVDIWAFGCVLFEMLTGSAALTFRTLAECVSATQRASIDWGRLPETTPKAIRSLLQGCLATDIEQRTASIADVRRTLDEVLTRYRDAEAGGTGDAGPNNLPAQLTTFVGRRRQLEQTLECLTHTCLLTLTGTGGSGKTRLGLEVARRNLGAFPDGVWLVEFASLQDEGLVPRTIASVLGLKEDPGRSVVETLMDYLKGKQLLFVFDNCEHMIEPISKIVSQLMLTYPDLKIIASSREAFNVPGEQIYHVEPMELPDLDHLPPVGELADNEAVALFVERARALKSSFELTEQNAAAVAQVCQSLDGIPLALELAAARIRVLSVNDIAERLADRFRLLRGGNKMALPHQKTLRAAIDWSYDQLDEQEQALLRRFAVFVGGWTLDSAEQVCSDDEIEDYEVLDLLANLVDKSLVEVTAVADGEHELTRYRSLETIRQYAWEKLDECGESAAMVERHGAYFLQLAGQADEKLAGPEQAQWFDLLELERGNTRAALQRFLADSADGGGNALQLVALLGHYWLVRGHWTEGRSFTSDALELSAATSGNNPRASALSCLGKLAMMQGDLSTSRLAFDEALRIRRELGDPSGIASALNDVAVVDRREGDLSGARVRLEESLDIARQLSDRKKTGVALSNLGLVALSQGDNDAAGDYYDEALGIFRELGDQQGIAVCLQSCGSVAYGREDFAAAATLYREALDISRSVGNRRTERNLLSNLGLVAHLAGRLDEARQFHEESVALQRELGDQEGVLRSLTNIARVAIDQKDRLAVTTMLTEGLEAAEQLSETTLHADLLWCAARFLAVSNAVAAAVRVYGLATTIAERTGGTEPEPTDVAWVSEVRAKVGNDSWGSDLAAGKTLSLAAVRDLVVTS